MLDSQQKRKINRFLYHKTTLVILSVLVVFAIRSTWMVYNKKLESENVKSISIRHKEELDRRNNELQDEIDRLNTPAGMEAEIRSKFSVAKGDENVVVIVDDSSEATNTAASSTSIWRRFLDLFK